MPSTTNPELQLQPGAKAYSGWRLAVYDTWVINIVSSYAWCCPTYKHLLPLYKETLRANHLDIGVGTGWFVRHSTPAPGTRISLSDLSPTALEAAKGCIPSNCELGNTLHADILKPLPTDERFDSITMFYLLHCLPGPQEKKLAVFNHIGRNLTADGVLAGATCLGPRDDFAEGWFTRFIRWYVIREGILDNLGDQEKPFVEALQENFETVETWKEGTILLFKARGPRNAGRT